jgi:hypothetical protein
MTVLHLRVGSTPPIDAANSPPPARFEGIFVSGELLPMN